MPAVPSNELPSRVSRFIAEHIPSVERLEILLLLFEHRSGWWSIDDIEEQIRSTRDSVQQNVSALVAGRLAVARPGRPEAYQFAGTSVDVDATVAELEASYRTRRVSVIQQIYSERQDSIRSFSDAFKLGRPHDR